ncbi:transcription factor SPT20 homolog isoform X1 [Acanthochromis polyacanthus]|uniref:transcription factor SPT20 homolog isoform X1 n=1 Tax=Acanthochromis polyacanthus TaxID=80966 RepID=UPI0022347395|nr:transcription factor SPT20 homolog isoform X1 [Acanthochromis polyacanthus]XP_051800657.1 transcription factor SPT20 homolog isoform X1 [Acanthochromis polyacanthus]XP_051800658.1 transcription factor SPT20 homolog isoform X1 [Acanthochromis polyacanthus]XP_051800659.1 transcription factor SPT20 homolog isoform X1 [Acanthochromis polyacanthus]XP_051800660.1 transcription factor SPT20 homolog isoform X1 [Acanthochromis polyacanthus]XP_051800661.1 transcription factor SPT20 homolog isoform X1
MCLFLFPGLSKPTQGTSLVPPKSRLQTPVTGPVAPRKVQRRPWSSAEKEAIWRQLAVHVLVKTVPGKEVCQRCLDLEPVLRGRHWKDIKNQVHNQIQSQKKQQFHAQMDLEENQEHQDQIQNQKKPQYQPQMDLHDQDNPQNQKRPQYQPQMDQRDQDNPQNQKRPQYQLQMNHQAQDSIQNQKKLDDHAHLNHQDHLHVHKKQLCHSRLDHQDHGPVHKKQLYQMDQQTLQTLDRDPSILTVAPYGPDGHRGPGHPLLDREPSISPYPLLHRAPGPHMDQLLSRTDWAEEALAQNYPLSRPLGRNLLQDVPPGGPPPDPHSGHVHF